MKVLVMLLLFVYANLAFSGERLKKEELDKLFSGKTVFYTSLKWGMVKAYYDDDKTLISVSENGKRKRGQWWIDKDKNMMCFRLNRKKVTHCRFVEKNKDGTYNTLRPDGTHSGKINASEKGDRL